MKITRKNELQEKLDRFTELKQIVKDLVTEQEEIKKHIKQVMAVMNTKVLVAGEYAACLTARTRVDLDKDLIAKLLGDEFQTVQKTVPYEIFEVKKA